jgi:hypothetical protein
MKNNNLGVAVFAVAFLLGSAAAAQQTPTLDFEVEP